MNTISILRSGNRKRQDGKSSLQKNLAAMRTVRKKMLEELWNKAEALKKENGNVKEWAEIKEGIREELLKMGERRTKEYKKVVHHIRRNPKVISKKYQEVLDDIKKLM